VFSHFSTGEHAGPLDGFKCKISEEEGKFPLQDSSDTKVTTNFRVLKLLYNKRFGKKPKFGMPALFKNEPARGEGQEKISDGN